MFEENNINIPILSPGDYIYTVLGSSACALDDQTTLTITIVDPSDIGNDINETFCKISGSVNLFSLLDRSTTRTGNFEDTDSTGALSTDGVLTFESLSSGIYNFRYVVSNTVPCEESVLNLEIQIIDVPTPILLEQEFCILDGVKLDDIETNISNYQWYSTLASETPILDNPTLLDNQKYYLEAIDANGCTSERLEVTMNILNIGERSSQGEFCSLDFQDGVSPNGDAQNDTFDLSIQDSFNIPVAFPDFELDIFNRYGSAVYEGNRNTEEFRGTSNLSIRLGDDLPSGVYYYIFKPNFDNNLPIQGSFYLSR